MKWKAPSERAQFIISSPVVIPLVVVAAPFFLLMAAMVVAEDWLARKMRPGLEFEPWFAWRPIRFSDWWDEENYGRWAWLEVVQRRWAHSYVEYRAAQAGEAGTAETVKQGSVHEHAVANGDAPKT